MASGDTLLWLHPYGSEPPSANYATQDVRNGHPVLDFDAATDESALWTADLPANYSGGGLTVILKWAATSATSGTCRWDVSIERNDDEGLDIDADSFASAQSVGASAPATSGQWQYSTVTFTSGAQMDSLAAGELFRIKVTRDADGSGGTDDMTGDAELGGITIKET